MKFRDKYGWPIERFVGKPITNFFRILLNTDIIATWRYRNWDGTGTDPGPRSMFTPTLENLVKALSSGSYPESTGQLVQGSALPLENLDISGMGLYTPEQRDALLAAGEVDDFFPAEQIIGERFGLGYLARRSDEGKKRHTFQDSAIKLHKILVKK